MLHSMLVKAGQADVGTPSSKGRPAQRLVGVSASPGSNAGRVDNPTPGISSRGPLLWGEVTDGVLIEVSSKSTHHVLDLHSGQVGVNASTSLAERVLVGHAEFADSRPPNIQTGL